MYCDKCRVHVPYVDVDGELTCPSCGGDSLRRTANDCLGKSPIRIVNEVRENQLELAKTIEKLLDRGEQETRNQHLIVEAGTGVGKSFAALIPALCRGWNVIVSTGTRVLQDQYRHAVLPYLREKLGNNKHDAAVTRFTYTTLKGKKNYVCPKEVSELQKEKKLKDYFAHRGSKKEQCVDQFYSWAMNPRNSGEWSDFYNKYNYVPLKTDRLSAEDCPGDLVDSICNEACGYGRARAVLGGSQRPNGIGDIFPSRVHRGGGRVAVVNHALLCLASTSLMRWLSDRKTLVVIDEAHTLEQYAAMVRTYALDKDTMEELFDDIAELRDAVEDCDSHTNENTENFVLGEYENLFNRLGRVPVSPGHPLFIDDAAGFGLSLSSTKREAENIADGLTRLAPEIPRSRETAILANRLHGFALRMRLLASAIPSDDASNAAFHSAILVKDGSKKRKGKGTLLKLYPKDSSRFISDTVGSRSVFMSATLTVDNSFDYPKERFGLEDPQTYQCGSAFDYRRRSLLYLPKGMPLFNYKANDEAKDRYFAKIGNEIVRLVSASRGCAFVLCVSRDDMEAFYRYVRTRVPYPTNYQRTDTSPDHLEQWFREQKDPVLFGVKSFWEGVSIEGDQLRMVIVPRVPFSVPTDPLYMVRKRELERKGVVGFNAFKELDLPEMVSSVKQGVGRLIRTHKDYGIAAILDARIVPGSRYTKRYSSTLLNSLPFELRTNNFALVQQALARFLPK